LRSYHPLGVAVNSERDYTETARQEKRSHRHLFLRADFLIS